MTAAGSEGAPRARLLRRGRVLEAVTLGWNVAGIIVLAAAAVAAGSVALAGFALDSLIEIGASIVVLWLWELAGSHPGRQQAGLRLIGAAFAVLAVYLTAQSLWALASGGGPTQHRGHRLDRGHRGGDAGPGLQDESLVSLALCQYFVRILTRESSAGIGFLGG